MYQQHGPVLRSIVLDLLYILSLLIYESKGWRMAMPRSKPRIISLPAEYIATPLKYLFPFKPCMSYSHL